MARALFAVLLTVCFLAPGVTAAAPVDRVTDATVNVYCTYKSGRTTYSTTGSGFFIDPKGIIITNAHVAAPMLLIDKKGKPMSDCVIRTGSPARDTYTARVLYISDQWVSDNIPELRKGRPRGTGERDFALLQVVSAKQGDLPSYFPFTQIAYTGTVGEGDPVIVAGYPAEGKSFKETRNKLELMTAAPSIEGMRFYVRPFADLLLISGSSLSASGASGGPITTADGLAIGMTTAVEQSKKDAEERTLRAITLSYVDRTLTFEKGTPLSFVLRGDLDAIASSTKQSLSSDLLSDLRRALLKRK